MSALTSTAVKRIPLEVLFGNPERTAGAISPDGTRLAFLAPVDRLLNIWVGASDGRDAQPVTHDTVRGIQSFSWAHDGRHLLYVQDTGGDENWRLHALDLQTREDRDLTPFEGVQAQILGLSKRRPSTVMVGLNRDDPRYHDVYAADLESGELTLVMRNPGFSALFGAWVIDDDLAVRAGFRPRDDGGFDLCAPDGEGWRLLLTIPMEDGLTSWPVHTTADGGALHLITSRDARTARLCRLDLSSGATTIIDEDPAYDAESAVLNPDTRAVELVTYLGDRRSYVVKDPSVRADVDALQQQCRGDLSVTSRDHADRLWTVAAVVDDGPGVTYLYDRSTRTARRLFEDRPDLAAYQLAPMEPFDFTARDGIKVHGYCTFPVDAERSNLPAILFVHGGPWARDVWGYNPVAQWMANRGYICVQVNYRGSTGYGKDFVSLGDRQWGASMHDDLIDAVDHLVAQGVADPSRIGILGGSYGGYAALVGATFTPDRFCCAVDLCGPSNLKTLIESVPPYWAGVLQQFYRRVGNPAVDAEFMWSRSPLSRVDDMRIPLLVAQGANDPRVKQQESEQIVAALRAKGLAYEYLLYPDEGHGLVIPANRLAFWAAAERFLETHLLPGGSSLPLTAG